MEMRTEKALFSEVPREIKLQILTLLSNNNLNNLYSLLCVSKAWKQLFNSMAEVYLNSISDKIKLIECYDVGLLKEELSKLITSCSSDYLAITNLEEIKENIADVTHPLTALYLCRNRINRILEILEAGYRYNPFLGNPLGSPIYCMLKNFMECHEGFNWFEETWFKNAKICAKLSAEHPSSKLIADAFSEINEFNHRLKMALSLTINSIH